MRITLAKPLCLSYLIATLLISSFTAIAQTASSSAPNNPPRATTGGSIKGIVVNEGGRPLSNVHISMRRVGFMDIQNVTTTTDREGRFEFSRLEPVSYQLSAARNWTTLKSGDRLPGLTITLAQGAASLHGGIALREGETPPANLYVYLVPSEKEKADDPLRFYSAAVTPEGKLGLNHVAPGRYWVIAQATTESLSPLTKLRLPDEMAYRAKVRRDAEAMKTEIELKPCQRIIDFQVPVKGN
ncbi:MAG TPA: carboxypeptidase-like regulatory domain-containing protein [Pyrinomonadaceae bacterium]|nr:carboxypeptidase-like regulatory domain-containing protein [Pyrinomonadaceae bacterium]